MTTSIKFNARSLVFLGFGLFALVFSVAGIFAFTYAQTGSPFPQDPVVGLIGAGHATCVAPANTPFSSLNHGGGLAGCSYQGLAEGPLSSSKHFSFTSAAESASFTYDIPNTGWHGWQWQWEELLNRTTWFDGPGGSPVSRLAAVIMSIPSDCGRTICTQEEINAYYDRVQSIVDQAKTKSVLPVIEEYPDWDNPQVNLYLTSSLYGFPPIEETYYKNLRQGHIDRFANQPGVLFVKPYTGDRYVTFDGFHPTPRSTQKIGKYMEEQIKNALGL